MTPQQSKFPEAQVKLAVRSGALLVLRTTRKDGWQLEDSTNIAPPGSIKGQPKHYRNQSRGLYLCRQSGAGVIHGGSGSALGGHVEGAAVGLLGERVSLGLRGRVRPY